MKLAILTFILTIQMAGAATLNKEINSNISVVPLFQEEVEDRGKCFALLEKVLVEAYGTYKDVQSKDYAKVIGDVIALGKDLVDDVKCFRDQNVKEVLEALLTRYSNIKDGTADCIVDHLETVLADMKEMLKDVFKGDWNAVQDQYNSIMTTFNDIQNG